MNASKLVVNNGQSPRRWAIFSLTGSLYILACSAIGLTTGVGAYTFHYAEGTSYLTDDPAACANCHVMQEQYAAWHQSSHGKFATCNDCHAPHGGLIEKYTCKARNGFFHSYAFTTGDFPEPIQITPYNKAITEAACRYCHQPIVQAIDTAGHYADGGEMMSCIRCHGDVGHPTTP